MPRPKVYPPSWCYPDSTEFECDQCGALPDQDCDLAPVYGPTLTVRGGHQVHRARYEARKAEMFRRVEAWKAEHCPVCGQPDNCGDCTHEPA